MIDERIIEEGHARVVDSNLASETCVDGGFLMA